MRTKLRLYVVMCCLLGMGLGMFTQTAAAQSDPKSEILRLVNNVRVQNGLPPYSYNATLAGAAQSQANWMAQTQIYSHTQTNGSTPQSRATAAGYPGLVAENIVGGTSLSPNQGIIWWQNSGVHLRTMLSTRHVEAGVGVSRGGDQTFYVLVVGHQSNEPPPRGMPDDQPDAPMFVAPIQIAGPREDGAIVHVVEEGQTAWAIAARYEIELNELLYLNSLPRDPILRPDDEVYIRLADGQAPPPTPTPPLTYIVQEGDTLWTIAAFNKVKIFDLLWFNQMTEESLLQPGDELVLHLAEGAALPPTPTPQMTHQVREGDTLLGIALRYGLTLDELLQYNGLTLDALLQIGQPLYIRPPVTETPAPATFTPAPTAAPTQTPTRETASVSLIADSGNPSPALKVTQAPSPTSAADLAAQNAPVNALTGRVWQPVSALGLIVFGVGLLITVGVAAVFMQRGRL